MSQVQNNCLQKVKLFFIDKNLESLPKKTRTFVQVTEQSLGRCAKISQTLNINKWITKST